MAHILLAEDDEALASFLTKSLKRAGHRVTSARDGLEAYDKLLKNRYDLLVTDLAMPGMDGIDLVKKAREQLIDIRVMFITGFSAVAIEANHNELGDTADVLSKPFHLKELTERIEVILSKQASDIEKILEKKIEETEKSKKTDKIKEKSKKNKETRPSSEDKR